MVKRLIVAIDGPAGAGKSTVARAIAEKLGFLYMDTGAMYRAVAYRALQGRLPLDDHEALAQLAHDLDIELDADLNRVLCDGDDVTLEIRLPDVSAAASRVSAVPGVRQALVQKQRRMALHRSVVMEGRDIGTVVFPDAQVKVFLDAESDVRARRRTEELQRKGLPALSEQVSQEMGERDRRDSGRAHSPLLQAPDAEYINTSGLTLEEVEERILSLIRERMANGKELQR